uniref:Uncharacterized protein n=1 Tax=Physcomitrium patens TaxID=3218 RepID=A0A2K1J4E6_PHYPA|nr:hypothetical protein PHYPA_022231 [Physcomitrium patens]
MTSENRLDFGSTWPVIQFLFVPMSSKYPFGASKELDRGCAPISAYFGRWPFTAKYFTTALGLTISKLTSTNNGSSQEHRMEAVDLSL